MTEYRPISCGAYDELEVMAMHRTRVVLVFLDSDDARSGIEGQVVDTMIRDGAEFLVLLSQGERTPVRLDRIIEIRDTNDALIWRQKTVDQPE